MHVRSPLRLAGRWSKSLSRRTKAWKRSWTFASVRVMLRASNPRFLAAETRRLKLQAMRTSGEETSRLTELRGLAGLAPDVRLALASQPELRAGAGVADLESAVALGFRLRPDLQAARLREESAERSIILARAGRIPNLNPFLGYNRETDVLEGIMIGPFPFVDKSNELVFGVSLDLPVFSRGQAQIAEAASARLQARAEMEALEREIRMEISSALQRVASSAGGRESRDDGTAVRPAGKRADPPAVVRTGQLRTGGRPDTATAADRNRAHRYRLARGALAGNG